MAAINGLTPALTNYVIPRLSRMSSTFFGGCSPSTDLAARSRQATASLILVVPNGYQHGSPRQYAAKAWGLTAYCACHRGPIASQCRTVPGADVLELSGGRTDPSLMGNCW